MGSDQNREGLVQDEYGIFEVPEGDLKLLAQEEWGSWAIGITSIFWLLWTVISMFYPYPVATTSQYQAPLWYLFTFSGDNAFFYSFLPTGYLVAWVMNTFLYLIELVAWWGNGPFYVLWSYVGCWGGFLLTAIPWMFEIVYILHEYPIRRSSSWVLRFYTGEFILVLGQGIMWACSWIIHMVALGPLDNMVNARRALKLGITSKCTCTRCEYKKNLNVFDRARAEKKCEDKCEKKCPKAIKCPLLQFENESQKSYDRRCRAAISLAQATSSSTKKRKIKSKDLLEARAEEEKDFDFTEEIETVEDLIQNRPVVDEEEEEIVEVARAIEDATEIQIATAEDEVAALSDLSSPEDEW